MQTKTKMWLWYAGLALVLGVVAFLVFRAGHPIAAFCVIIVPLSMIANGLLAEWEDNRPGGFNRPTQEGTVNQKDD